MHQCQDAQELFDNLQLSLGCHDDQSTSATEDSFLHHTLKSASHRHEACGEKIDVEGEFAKLISFFENQEPQPRAQARAVRNVSMTAASVVLPPPVKYSRASRKVVAQPPT